MRLFPLDPNPSVSAAWLDDREVSGSIAAVSVMLAESMNFVRKPWSLLPFLFNPKFQQLDDAELYWLRSSAGNTRWVLSYGVRLLYRLKPQQYKEEYTAFFRQAAELFSDIQGKYRSQEATDFLNQTLNPRDLKKGNFTKEKDVHLAYKLWLTMRWNQQKSKPTWDNNGLLPAWYNPTS